MRLSITSLVLFIFCGQGLSAQELTLISTGGGLASSGEMHLAYSIGEPMVQYAQSNATWLTEGFQQPGHIDLMVSTGQQEIYREITVYPNPATTTLTITGNDLGGCTSITLHNLVGQRILTTTLASKNSYTVTLDDIHPGLFIITVQCPETQYRTQSIIKL